jgi:hypothetical protein
MVKWMTRRVNTTAASMWVGDTVAASTLMIVDRKISG